MNINSREIKRTSLNWIESFVIDLNLCPFAKREVRADKLKLSVTNADNDKDLIISLEQEIQYLLGQPNIETTLLIHPNVLLDFREYNDFLVVADKLLEILGAHGVLQIASFHPDYQFAGTHIDDPENFTNKSPYPMLHLLRESSVTRAIEQHADSSQIPEDNIVRLREIGKCQLEKLFVACFTHS